MRRVVGGNWTPPERPGEADVAATSEQAGSRSAALERKQYQHQARSLIFILTARGIPGLVASAVLRFRSACWHPEGGGAPALVALVQNVVGSPIAVHRTYLSRDGSAKANLDPPKASLGPTWGGAIRLDPLAAEMVIGEGIESAASAGCMLELPAWAAISAGNLARGLVLPPQVRSVVIAVDADPPTARARGRVPMPRRRPRDRWRVEGRHVRIAVPDEIGRDFNDLLLVRARG